VFCTLLKDKVNPGLEDPPGLTLLIGAGCCVGSNTIGPISSSYRTKLVNS
jgi:hypothetical protein